ncbi:MAG: glycosyltransferase, partial [Nanoarchaeota archaeon]
MNQFKLSIIIPSYNESLELKKEAVDVVDSYLKTQEYPYEVLIVDDESTNGTLDELKVYAKNKKGFKILENKHGGKAITVMTGLLQSTGDIAIFTDMDQATPINETEKLLTEFEKGFDIVIGSRKGREGAPITRKITAWGFATLRNIILGLPVKDTQCGFKGFKREAIEQSTAEEVIGYRQGYDGSSASIEVRGGATQSKNNTTDLGVYVSYSG